MSVSLRFLNPLPCDRLAAPLAVVGEAAQGAVRNGAPPGVPVS
jgi:hypothetical protein